MPPQEERTTEEERAPHEEYEEVAIPLIGMYRVPRTQPPMPTLRRVRINPYERQDQQVEKPTSSIGIKLKEVPKDQDTQMKDAEEDKEEKELHKDESEQDKEQNKEEDKEKEEATKDEAGSSNTKDTDDEKDRDEDQEESDDDEEGQKPTIHDLLIEMAIRMERINKIDKIKEEKIKDQKDVLDDVQEQMGLQVVQINSLHEEVAIQKSLVDAEYARSTGYREKTEEMQKRAIKAEGEVIEHQR